ncbi:hypothetical protein [Cesiribacter sp. SM1]|uniref:hypothetical protein n=1 Tax=Cesiribacter sp. SM1 TaxID=2861196 RepID=UPI001CD53F88|nr:hypothetical protein [Cesiribacter sp. SM1]
MHLPKKLSCLIFCLGIITTAFAQKELYFRPGMLLNSPVEHLIHKDQHTAFRYNNHNLYLGWGIEFFYRANNKTDIYAGYQNSRIDINYSLYGSHRYAASIEQSEFPLAIEWLLKDVRLFPMSERPKFFGKNSTAHGYYFLALFRLKAITGISLSHVTTTEGIESVNYGQQIFVRHYILPQHFQNFSVFGGLSLQFYNRKRDKLHLTLLYNQGLRRVAEMEIKEYRGRDTFSARLGSRGSYFAAQLKVPIRLVTFKS